jgi:glutamyl-tRNA synthetase
MIKTRFAPSPTGYLHIGGARTCLFSWLAARRAAGKFILRIEDTDKQRSKKEYLEEILTSLKWLGLNWDELYYQSERFSLYREQAELLIKKGVALEKEGAVFFNYDFDQVVVDDLIRGEVKFTELPKQEEVLIKSDGTPTYNFSCVVDDALMGITHVIRGEDHLSNTPKQILMYKALGFKVPEFAHLPMILSPQGGRMSKRHGATAISEYKKEGFLPEALFNYFLLLGWSPKDDREIISQEQAKELFRLQDVNKTGSAFSLDKLTWLNGQYIKNKDLTRLVEEVKDYLISQGLPYAETDIDYLKEVVNIFKTRLNKLSEFPEKAGFCFTDDIRYTQDSEEVLETKIIKEMKTLKQRLSSIKDFNKDNIEAEFRSTAKDLGVKVKVLVHPTRVALTGSKNGPGLFETLCVLGKERVIQRLDKLIEYWTTA